MKIQVLYFEGCPNHEPTVARVRHIARLHGVEDPVEMVEVRSPEEAEVQRFLGSPTVRIDGADIDPAAHERKDFSLVCRLYGASGVPPESMIEAAIRSVKR